MIIEGAPTCILLAMTLTFDANQICCQNPLLEDSISQNYDVLQEPDMIRPESELLLTEIADVHA